MYNILVKYPSGDTNTISCTEYFAEKHFKGMWEFAANQPQTKEPAVPVVQSCTRRQGRLYLQSIGALDLAESFIQTIEDEVDRKVALIEYEADTWEINNPFVIQMWESLGGTQESLVEAFRVAVTL